MIEDAEIIVREDFEPVVKAEVEAEIINDKKTLKPPENMIDNVESRLQGKNKNDELTKLDKRYSDTAPRPRNKRNSEDRSSMTSISSFSSSFVIDRIFHWRGKG